MKTAVIYARYSSDSQTEQSIEGQLRVCEQYAKNNNFVILNTYIDRAMTGTNDNRPDFQQMIKDSANKEWQYVIVYKLDRFSRNKYETAKNKKILKDNDVKLLSAMENIPDTPEGIILESLLEGMNQYFSEELAQKVSRGLHESRMKGHIIGSVPYGYIKENKMLKVNEEEKLILTRMFEDYASGKTILQISRDFEKENITNKGKKFIPETIRYYLKNEYYTGICRINNKVYDKIYPQIISKELFEKVKIKLDSNKYGCRKDNHEIFRLKDKIYCGNCNRKMYPVSAISSNGNAIRYYKCITTKKKNCLTGIIDKNFIESIIDKFLISQFNIPKNLNEISEKIFEIHKKRVGTNNSLNSLKSNLQKTNTSIANIMSAIEKGILTDTTKQRLEELENQKKDLQEKLIIEQSKQQFELTKEDIQNYFKFTMKQCPDRAIELFIQKVNIYESKIEKSLNYSLNTNISKTETTSKKLFTETFTSTRKFKGGTTKTTNKVYEVYLII